MKIFYDNIELKGIKHKKIRHYEVIVNKEKKQIEIKKTKKICGKNIIDEFELKEILLLKCQGEMLRFLMEST